MLDTLLILFDEVAVDAPIMAIAQAASTIIHVDGSWPGASGTSRFPFEMHAEERTGVLGRQKGIFFLDCAVLPSHSQSICLL